METQRISTFVSMSNSSAIDPRGKDTIRRSAVSLSAAIGLCLIMALAQTAPGADFSAWQYKAKISFPGYTKTETLSDFPATVNFHYGLPGFSYSQFADANAGDLRFAASNETTELDYEIEKWDAAGDSTVWVKIPLLEKTNTYIWAYWGNPAETNPPASTTNGAVWNANYRGVWHMASSSGTNAYDATSAKRDGYLCANAAGTDWQPGLMGNTYRFDGTNDFVGVVFDSPPTNNATYEFWINTPTQTPPTYMNYGLCSIRAAELGNAAPNFDFYIVNLSIGAFLSSAPLFSSYSTPNPADGQWHQIVETFGTDGDEPGRILFVDGLRRINDGTQTMDYPGTNYLHFGWSTMGNPTPFFGGMMDEMRVSDSLRSANWIWASYRNAASNSTFNSHGDVQSTNPIPPVVNNDGGASNVSYQAATLNGNLTSTGNIPTEVRVYWGTSDGGKTFDLWANSNIFGTLDVGFVSTNITGLNASATYYYAFYVTNAAGDYWASPTTFATAHAPEAPMIDNDGGVTSLTATSAVMRGNLISTGYIETAVVAYWGTKANHRTKITFSGYNKPETLNNFPVLVVFNTNIPNFAYSQFASADGGDLRFKDSSETTLLNYEIEKWAPDGNSYIWVQVPQLANSSDHIWAYWGNPAETNLPASMTNGATWETGYSGVWHLASSSGSIASDSTSAKRNGNMRNISEGDWTAGNVGNAFAFDGVNDFMSVPWRPPTNNCTTEFWIKTTDTAVRGFHDATLAEATGYGDRITYLNLNNVTVQMDNEVISSTGANIANGQWRHVVHVFGSDIGGQQLYIDGVLKASGNKKNPDLGQIANYEEFGWDNVGSQYFHGMMDEIRVSAAARSANWIWASYMNQASNSLFQSVEVGVGGAPSQTPWSNTNYLGANAQGIVSNYVSGLTSNTTYYYAFYATNVAGDYWAPTITNFTTLSAPVIDNDGGASNVTATTALLAGNLTWIGGAPTIVQVYWGTTDGGQVKDNWANTNDLGASATGRITSSVSTLSSNTTYYYVYYATNSVGDCWAPTATSFTTLSAPIIDNDGGASNITARTAVLNGNLSWTGGAPTTVFAYWGISDGAQTATNWANSSNLGAKASGLVTNYASGFSPGNMYYYTFYATNSVGDCWAPASTNFVTPPEPPVIDNDGGASNVTATAAVLNGVLTSAGGAVTIVQVYWGTNDGGQVGSNWANMTNLGANAEGFITNYLSGLNMGTTYYYTFYATNSAGDCWASSPPSFTTPDVPHINNAGGATNVTMTTAVLAGNLTSTGGIPTTVYVYWGTTDGGQDEFSWETRNNLGVKAVGSVDKSLSGLTPGTMYYYSFYARNAVGDAWATPVMSFIAPLTTPFRILMFSKDASGTAVTWESVSNMTYSVHKSTNLIQGWLVPPLITNLTGDVSGTNMFLMTNATERNVYYSIRAQKP